MADVNRVARHYLDLDHAVSAVMVPRGSGRPVAPSGGFRRSGKHRTRGGQSYRVAGLGAGRCEPAHGAGPDHASGRLDALKRPDTDRSTRGRQRYRECLRYIRNRPEVQAPRVKQGYRSCWICLLPYGTEAARSGRLRAGAGRDWSARARRYGLFAADANSISNVACNCWRPMNCIRPCHAAALEILRSSWPSWSRPATESGASGTTCTAPSLFPKHDPSLREATPETVLADAGGCASLSRASFRPDLATWS